MAYILLYQRSHNLLMNILLSWLEPLIICFQQSIAIFAFAGKVVLQGSFQKIIFIQFLGMVSFRMCHKASQYFPKYVSFKSHNFALVCETTNTTIKVTVMALHICFFSVAHMSAMAVILMFI